MSWATEGTASLGSAAALAYASGLVAAVSPCVVVLIPLLLFRFARPVNGGAAAAPKSDLAAFVFGFQTAYLFFGYGLSMLLSSSIQEGVKMGLGCGFALTGAISLTDRIDPIRMPVFSSPTLMGASFAVLISVNPCTVPFLALVISMSTAHALWSLFWFGLGLLSPALGFVLLGKSFLSSLKSWNGLMHSVNRVMSLVLVGSGFWLANSSVVLSRGDMWIAALITCSGVAFLAVAFEVHVMPERQRPGLMASAAVCGLLLLCALVYGSSFVSHLASTHTALGAAAMAEAAAGATDTCVDVSTIQPCSPCAAFRRAVLAIVAMVSVAVGAIHWHLSGAPSLLPITSPASSGGAASPSTGIVSALVASVSATGVSTHERTCGDAHEL